MQELKAKVQALIDKYEKELSLIGIKINVSKRYFEVDVKVRSKGIRNGEVILYSIERWLDKKRENHKYHYEKNKYHCFVLSLNSIGKKTKFRKDSKEYAYLLRKVERAHLGMKPSRVVYEEEKILSKIERRIQKIINKAKKSGADKVCKDSICDAFRYHISPKYNYKNNFCGKDRYFWDLFFFISYAVIILAIMACIWFT